MAKELSDAVFDAALAVVKASNKAQVRTAASSILINSIGLNSSNFTGPAAGSPSGRQLSCLVSSASDMLAISVTSAGAAKRIALLTSSVLNAVAEVTSAVSLGASDQVNLGSFITLFPDPT